MPDIELGLKYHLSTGKSDRIKLSDYKGKLLVLDFLHTGCKACMEALPEFRNLELTTNNFNVLCVTKETVPEINNWFFWTKRDKAVYPEFIIQDSLLKHYFPHKVISHLVWIDTNRVIKAITDKSYLIRESIAKMMAGQEVDWPVKREIVGFDFSLPLMEFNRQVPDDFNNLLTYSVIKPYLNGVFGRLETYTDSLRQLQRITWYNKSILDLYLYAYDTGKQFPNSQIEMKTPKLSRFFYEHSTDDFYRSWTARNQYCYETVMPLNITAAEKKQRIRQDLDNKFGLRVRMVKKEVDCYALVVSRKVSGSAAPINSVVIPAEKRKLYTPISSLHYVLNNSCLRPPVLDETGLPENYYIPGIISTINIPEINSLLYKSGLQLIPVKRLLPILIIAEADK